MVDSKKSLIYPLNATAAQIWQLLDGARSLEEITKIIQGEFDAQKEDIESDVSSFISQLKEAGLIEKI